MGGSGSSKLLYMMDSAFDGQEWHSLLKNLGSVNDDEWDLDTARRSADHPQPCSGTWCVQIRL